MEEMNSADVLTVSELTTLIRGTLEGEFPSVWVQGEVSNLVRAASGHLYFSLKDERAQLPSVMFRSRNTGLDFEPRDGLSVLAMGRVSIYPPSGRYQLILSELRPLGRGLLHLEYERLKERLKSEGLFDESRKKALPQYPSVIGIITSPKGAAIRDMISIIGRRYPMADIILFPVRVQGEGAAEEIAHAIEAMNRWGVPDVLIVGRGGGSLEDLWAFNEEVVARAISSSVLPVVSAVGHEIDFTISDLVSDIRAPTPSAAGELIVPDSDRLLSNLRMMEMKMRREVELILERLTRRFQYLASSHGLKRVPGMIEEMIQRLDRQHLTMKRDLAELLHGMEQGLADLAGRLDILSPLATLARGYSITYRLPGGGLVRKAAVLSMGDRVGIRFEVGKAECEVLEVEER